MTSGSNSLLRAMNRDRVLEMLRSPGTSELTQADLTRRTGLAAGTVSSIVHELEKQDLIDTVAGAGRRGKSVRLSRSAGLVAGVSVRDGTVGVVVADLGANVLADLQRPVGPDGPSAEHDALQLLVELCASIGADISDLRHIGVSHETARPDSELLDALTCPVFQDSATNFAAIAEHTLGASRGHRDAVYVEVSSTITAAFILDDRLFRGSAGHAGALGHLTVDSDGPLCVCGKRGCLELFAGSDAVLRLAAGPLAGRSIEALMSAAADGERVAVRALEDAGEHLGWGAAALIDLLNPAVVVLGGPLSSEPNPFVGAVRRSMRRNSSGAASSTPLVRSVLGDAAPRLGAMVSAAGRTTLSASTGTRPSPSPAT